LKQLVFLCFVTHKSVTTDLLLEKHLTPVFQYFPFGNLNCNEGKRCQLSCGPGTVLVGAGESMCNDRVPGIVRWNPPIGLCRSKNFFRSCSV